MQYYEFWVNHNCIKEEYFQNDKKAIIFGKRYVLNDNIVNIYKHEASRVTVAQWKNNKRIQ